MNSKKVIVIGIDGGTFDVILPMINRGELPTLASLIKEGVRGELQSTIPTNTGPAWVSMMTGVNPGKHGIFFFLGNRHHNYMCQRTLGSTDIKFPPLWSILSRNMKKVIFVNVPFTYPPIEVNGVLVSGMLIPRSAKEVSYPPNIYPDLVRRLGGYEINDWQFEVIGATRSTAHLYYDKIIKLLSESIEDRKKGTIALLEENDWDFSMVVFTAIDRLQHLFWKFLNPTNCNGDHLSKYRNAIYDGYRQLDNAIGEILEKAGRDITVMIVSDHGFGPSKKDFFVNKWLEEIGLLKVNKFLTRKKLIFKSTNLQRILARISPTTKTPNWTEKIPIFLPWSVTRGKDEMINWEKTKAYADEFGININLRGREPYGIVNPGRESEELLTFIQEQFYQLVDESESQEKIADWILRKEEIFSGRFMGEATDLYLSVKNESYLLNAGIGAKDKFGKSLVLVGTGIHRMKGIFIMTGPLCSNCDSVKARIIDITPTILYLMGLPVLEEMDGRVLEDIMDPAYLKLNPIKRITSWGYGGESSPYSSEDEEKIKEGLKGLGYLS